jgi:hypothetical protein
MLLLGQDVLGPPDPAFLPGQLIALLVMSGVFLLLLTALAVWGRIWLRALLAGCYLSIVDVVGMRLRGVPVGPLVDAWILAHRYELGLRREQLEVHVLAGGDALRLVRALALAKTAGHPLAFERLCAEQLAGRDVLAWVQACVRGDEAWPEGAAAPAATAEARVQSKRAGDRCPYCHDGVEPEGAAACVECMARHHVGCWDEHGQCASCGHRERYTKIERTAGREVRRREGPK